MSRTPQQAQAPRRALILSCVGGGPMERLARRLGEQGLQAAVLAGATPEKWRGLMASGTFGRVRARLGAFLIFPLRALIAALGRSAEILIPTTNPFYLPFLLVMTRPIHRRIVIPLIYDLYPDALEGDGVSKAGGLASRVWAAANTFLFERADGVAFIGEEMGRHARARYGEPRRWLLAETGADTEEFSAPASVEAADPSSLEAWCEGKVIVAYVGNMGRVHDWETLAKAGPGVLTRARRPVGLVIAASGPGALQLQAAWAHLPSEQVRFEAPLDDQGWVRLMRRVQISVVTLRSSAKYTSIPSKAFSAMAAGAAIMAIAPEGSDVATLVVRHGCGSVSEPGNDVGVERDLLALIDDEAWLERCRHRSKDAASTHYDMPVLAHRWKTFLAEVNSRARGVGLDER